MNNEYQAGANEPSLENTPPVRSKLKDYGKKSLGPISQLLDRYQGELMPYVEAMVKGLETASESLRLNEPTVAQSTVSSWFGETATWLNETKTKLTSGDSRTFITYLEERTQKQPGLAFTSSYIVGIALGRLGRHVIKNRNVH